MVPTQGDVDALGIARPRHSGASHDAGVSGGAVYDALVALTASEAGATS